MPSGVLVVLDWYTPIIMIGGALIFTFTWGILLFIGLDLRGGRGSWSLALSSLLLTALLYITIFLGILGTPWWLLGIYIFFTGVAVFLYLGSIYGDESSDNNKQSVSQYNTY